MVSIRKNASLSHALRYGNRRAIEIGPQHVECTGILRSYGAPPPCDPTEGIFPAVDRYMYTASSKIAPPRRLRWSMDNERGQAFSQRCSRKKRNTPRARTKSLRRMTTKTYPCRSICQPVCVLTPHKTPNNHCLRPPSLICLTRATPRALLQLAAAGYRGFPLGRFGCHRPDELLLPKPH